MSLHCLVKIKMLTEHVLSLSCQRKYGNFKQNLSCLNCGLQNRQIWIQLIIACRNIAREGVQNTYHWYGSIDDPTDETLPQWRHDPTWTTLLCQCFSSSRSVEYFEHLLQYSPHSVINWIQIWRVWKPQLRWNKFWSFFN